MERRSREFKSGNVIIEKALEAFKSVFPITVIVLIIGFFIAPIPVGALLSFQFGAMLLIAGMALFTLGTDIAMTPIGEHVGQLATKSRKLWIIAFVGVLVGILITVSEPDLQVLAEQVPGLPNIVLILAVAIGVGLFLVVALMRILFGVGIRIILLICYAFVFLLSQFIPREFVAVAFDSGGVTTGPMTVPFILALGVGLSSIRNDPNSENDCFGLVALCSIGPILAVMLLGLFFRPDGADYSGLVMTQAETSLDVTLSFSQALPKYALEVALSLSPITVMFIVMRVFWLKIPIKSVVRILMGIIYTYVGLVLFLVGVNVGFMPVGSYVGSLLAAFDQNWIIIPIGMIMGYFVVSAEPAVHVLSRQVYEITAGAIPQKALRLSLSIGVSVSVGLSLWRILAGIDILTILAPGYVLSFAIMPFTPKIFTSIAFDSGGVASGAMTTTFLLPLTMGACAALGGDIAVSAFGVVAMVAMTPLITIQVLGIAYRFRKPSEQALAEEKDDIIEL